MGYFDESSEEEEEVDPHKKQQEEPENDDHEDPLDAYMKSLETRVSQQQTSDVTQISAAADGSIEEERDSDIKSTNHHERLDLEDQDIDPVGVFDGSSGRSEYYEGRSSWTGQKQDEELSSQARHAKEALANTFVKSNRGTKDSSGFVAPAANFDQNIECIKKFWEGNDTVKGKHWRRDNHVTLHSDDSHHRSNKGSHAKIESSSGKQHSWTIDPIFSFSELANVWSNHVAEKVASTFMTPTLVQSQTLSVALSGHDVLVTAATGQGKTLAYLWPVLVHAAHQPALLKHETGPMALVLVPTRELAVQVQKQCHPYCAGSTASSFATSTAKLRCRAVIGGQGKYMLQQELKREKVHICIATPGRLLDVLSDKRGLSLARTTMVVLDEADKMLQMGFEHQVRTILGSVRSDRHTMLLSATMPNRVRKLAQEWMNHPVRISVGRTGQASVNVDQHVMVLPNEAAKVAFLVELLPTLSRVGRTLVFCGTRQGCESLADTVRQQTGLTVRTLHGDLHQSDRTSAVRAFTKDKIRILIASDVASRGLDVPNVQTVLSFDPPKNLDAHVHRVGRAGRLSSSTTSKSKHDSEVQQPPPQQCTGSAYTLLTSKNAAFAQSLLQAFQREGRLVTPEFQALATSTSHSRSQTATERGTGLGFSHPLPGTGGFKRNTDRALDHQYAKRNRWS